MPVVATKTAVFLQALRLLLNTTFVGDGDKVLSAYIIPSGDAHHTELTAPCHQRRAFISGFTGSEGTAVITQQFALLWTDGRYFLQAEQQLDLSVWTLMKDGLPDTLSQGEWLNKNLPDGAFVGVDPTLYSTAEWDPLFSELKTGGKSLVGVANNLVDGIWETRQPCSTNILIQLGMEFSGKASKDKLKDIREEMVTNRAQVLVLTELDEIAWLLNLRGNRDLPNSATFFSYVILTATKLEFFVNQTQLNEGIKNGLKAQEAGLSFKEYDQVVASLKKTIAENSGKIWLSKNANYALVSVVPEDRRIIKLTPISLMKAVKNDVEVAGYRKASIRDSAVITVFLAWLETAVQTGQKITEISAAEKLHSLRSERENFLDESFPTVSSTGPNAAVLHYLPTKETNRPLDMHELYLLDSGGLYYDGTTDIARTIHFSTPTDHERETYTRVLKGQIALSRMIFSSYVSGQRLDSFARQALWEVGLDYPHATGHGIGSFLNAHEGPHSISPVFSPEDSGLLENMLTSNEPGYYEDNQFGIRLENIMRVISKPMPNYFHGVVFLGFEDLTFVPYQHKMIKFELLNEQEIKYLNEYQVKCREIVGDYIKKNYPGDTAYDWLMRETQEIKFVDNHFRSASDGIIHQSLCCQWMVLLLITLLTF